MSLQEKKIKLIETNFQLCKALVENPREETESVVMKLEADFVKIRLREIENGEVVSKTSSANFYCQSGWGGFTFSSLHPGNRL